MNTETLVRANEIINRLDRIADQLNTVEHTSAWDTSWFRYVLDEHYSDCLEPIKQELLKILKAKQYTLERELEEL